MSPATPAALTDLLGEERPVRRTYPDGSFDCPFCSSAVPTPAARCANPWCSASVDALAHPESAPSFRKRAERLAREEVERTRRRRDNEAAMRRIGEDRAAREAAESNLLARVQAARGCWRCSSRLGRVTRHRIACPRAR